MRKWPIPVAVAISSLVLASVALAQFTQTASVTLTAHKAGQSTGIKSSIVSSDPTAPGAKPKPAKTVTITFPAKTKFDLSTPLVKRCKLSTAKLTATGGGTCPGATKIGTGSASANASPLLTTPVTAAITAYVRSKNAIILVATTNVANPQVIAMSVSGSKLAIPVPTQNLGGIIVVLESLKFNVRAIGTGTKALVTAGKCTAHKWVVATHVLYTDGTTFDGSSTTACS